jgi:hypothetical protein
MGSFGDFGIGMDNKKKISGKKEQDIRRLNDWKKSWQLAIRYQIIMEFP